MKTEPAVILKVSGLKCDSKGCGFVDPTVKLTLATLKKNTNRPCPKCGANLLTPEDALATALIISTAKLVNSLTAPLSGKRQKREHYRVKMNGTGKVKFEKVDK